MPKNKEIKSTTLNSEPDFSVSNVQARQIGTYYQNVQLACCDIGSGKNVILIS